MISWKNLNNELPNEYNRYLVTDGKHVDIALYEMYDEDDGARFFLPEDTSINDEENITHFAIITLPEI